jgi:thioesterase domain-containing protein
MLAGKIEEQFTISFSPSNIISNPTVRTQARFISELTSGEEVKINLPSYVTHINSEGNMPPLFFIHGANGFSLIKKEFFQVLGDDQPCYLFQAPGINGRDRPLHTVNEFASAYADVIRSVVPDGPWRIVSTCAGSLISLELCNVLESADNRVDKLILIDPPPVPEHLLDEYPIVGRSVVRKNMVRLWRKCANALRGHGFVLNTEESVYRRSLEQRANIEKRIRQKRYQSDLVSASSSYDPDVVLRASLAVTDALSEFHPSPWNGRAYMVVSTVRRGRAGVKKDPFWLAHLSEIVYFPVRGKHRDIFTTRLKDVAGYVAEAVKDPS